jgi:O-antigen ligase
LARWAQRSGAVAIALLMLVPPFLISLAAREAFRLPKLVIGEWLALAGLFCLCFTLDEAEPAAGRRVDWRALARSTALRMTVPMLAVATLSLAFTAAPHFVRDGLIDLWIGAACFVAWTWAFPAMDLRKLLAWMMPPAVVLALLGILQFHGVTPLRFLGEQTQRLGVTSLAGNPGDLGAFLVLPCLLAQVAVRWRQRRAVVRWLWVAALVVCLYGLVASQTLTALVGLAVGTAVLWWRLLPRRRALALFGGGALVLALAVLMVAPLRMRVKEKVKDLRGGEVNRLLTGRLDGWWAALWMVEQEPWTGVGHGAYRASFSRAKLALTEDGVEFLRGHNQPFFSNAHNEYLEVAAEWGLPGLAALAWALWLLAGCLRRLAAASAAVAVAGTAGAKPVTRARPGPVDPDPAGDAAFAWGGVAALAMVALTFFPFRIALCAFPALLFLAWVVRCADEAQPADGSTQGSKQGSTHQKAMPRAGAPA